jgi:hypothetical protein
VFFIEPEPRDDVREIKQPLEIGEGRLCKKHRRQGPIDDAFLEPFLVVRPTRVFREM